MTAYPSSGSVTVRTNLADSTLTTALKSGEIDTGQAAFAFTGAKAANTAGKFFKAMVCDKTFDAGELAIVTYFQAKACGKPLVLLPATVLGRFQHHCIGYNIDRGKLTPKDLEGRRVGVRAYTQTTGMWVRGILQHENGVDLNRITWVCQEDSVLDEYREPANVERTSSDKAISEMLLDGEIEAAILGYNMPDDARIKSLIANPREAALASYAKSGALPLNHLFVVSSELSKARPDVVRDIYNSLLASKAAMGEISEPDMLPFGCDNIRKGVELAIDYSFEQKLIPRRLEFEELFDETTRRL